MSFFALYKEKNLNYLIEACSMLQANRGVLSFSTKNNDFIAQKN